MNKIIDTIISTQIATFVACVCTYVAHIIENGTILNENWMWAVYVLMGIAVIFWLFPYLVMHEDKPQPSIEDILDTYRKMRELEDEAPKPF